jgi:hypothetical protein
MASLITKAWLAILAFLTLVPSSALADPWKDESGRRKFQARRGHWEGRLYRAQPPWEVYRRYPTPPYRLRPPAYFPPPWHRDRDDDDWREDYEEWLEERREREEEAYEEWRERMEDRRERERDRFKRWRDRDDDDDDDD